VELSFIHICLIRKTLKRSLQNEKALVEQILENDETPILEEPTDELLKDMFYLDESLYESQYTMFSMFRTSATNVSIVNPKENQYDAVKDAFTKRKEDVLDVFEHYAMELTISVPTNGCVIEKMVALFYLC
jgi:hypothetical protein